MVVAVWFHVDDAVLVVGIDECSSGTHNCHPNATCTDTVGGFQCRCNAPAHIGNGTHCSEDQIVMLLQ